MSKKVSKLMPYVKCSECKKDMLDRGPSALQWCSPDCFKLWSGKEALRKVVLIPKSKKHAHS